MMESLREHNWRQTSVRVLAWPLDAKMAFAFRKRKRKQKFYAVREGRSKGVFATWEECRAAVRDCPAAVAAAAGGATVA